MTAPGARDAILEAADRLFGEVGFEGATTRLIGDASGINKALIHYHFRDKQDLWNAVLDRYYDALGQAMRAALARPARSARVGASATRSSRAATRSSRAATRSSRAATRSSRAATRSSRAAARSAREALQRLLASYVDFLVAHTTFARMVQREVASGRHVARITEHMVPLFGLGTAFVESAWPAARKGDLAAPQLLISFYGMAVTWVTYAPVVARLAGPAPLEAKALAARKRHLRRMVDLVIDALEDTRKPSKERTP